MLAIVIGRCRSCIQPQNVVGRDAADGFVQGQQKGGWVGEVLVDGAAFGAAVGSGGLVLPSNPPHPQQKPAQ